MLHLSYFSHNLGNNFMFSSKDLSYDVASGSEISLVVYRFTGNVMTSITTLRTLYKIITFFFVRNEISKYLSYDK